MDLAKRLMNKHYEVYLSGDGSCLELHSEGQLSSRLDIQDILNFNYFMPKQFINNDKYWLSLKTKTHGSLFFRTQFSDESFLKDLLALIAWNRLEEMRQLSVKRLFAYYLLPLILVGIYFANFGEKNFSGLLVLGIFTFIFNSIGIYSELSKFKKYKKMKVRSD